MKPKLYLITKDFPYGNGETSFIKPEYPYLCDKFQVSVIATEAEKTECDTEIRDIDALVVPVRQNIFDKAFSFLRFLCEKDCHLEIAAIIKEGKQTGRRIFRSLMFGTAAETFYRRLKKAVNLQKNTNALFYFYWFDYRCFGLTMHRHKFPNIQIIARTHGCDLYDERELYGKQFFQPQMDRRLDRLIFAAQYAKDYYLERYGKRDTARYLLCRLGVSGKDVDCDKRKEQQKKAPDFLMVSCSHAVDIKRIDLIIDGLSVVEEREISWVHIGDGEQLIKLQEEARQKLGNKKNVRYRFMGMLSNSEVLRFYQENYVGCFITTTRTEGGAPVSVQEALSFGIPVIATKIGELPQMVRDNGILISENPQKAEVGGAISHMADIFGREEYFRMCHNSLVIFEEKFCAEKNFSGLVAELDDLTPDGNE